MLGPFATASRYTAMHQVSLLSHAACASMSTTTTTTTTTTTSRDRGDRYGPIEWASDLRPDVLKETLARVWWGMTWRWLLSSLTACIYCTSRPSSEATQQHVCYTVRARYTTSEHVHTPCLKKLCQCYFLNNSVTHWPILIIFGTQHHEETWRK